MNEQQVSLVQATWKTVAPLAPQVAEMFYGRLFELRPELEALFKGDMKSQGSKLTTMLNAAVVNLHDLESVLPAVKSLGRRHVDYGVAEADYATVGEALLWTLEQGLGDAFTAEVKEAWTLAYTALATTMINAAEESAVA